MREDDQTVLDELREVYPITAAGLAKEMGENAGEVRRCLSRLESAGFVDCDDYQQPRGAAKWGPKGWGEA